MCICIRGPKAIECFLAHDIVIVAARLFLLFITPFCWATKDTGVQWGSRESGGLLLKFRFV